MVEAYISKKSGIILKKRVSATVLLKRVLPTLVCSELLEKVSHGRLQTLKSKWLSPKKMECLA